MAPKKPNPSTTTTATTTSNKKKKTTRSETDIKTLKTLGKELLSSRSHINNLPILLTYIVPSVRPAQFVEALLSLQSFFSPILTGLPSSSAKADGTSDAELIYRMWLRAKFDELVVALLEIIVSDQCEDTLREVVLDTIMEFVKLGSGGNFNSSLYHKLIQKIVCSSVEVDFLLESLASSYFKYIDVRYFTYIEVNNVCTTLESKNISGAKSVAAGDVSMTSVVGSIKKIHFILSRIPPLEDLAVAERWSSGLLSEDNSNQNSECKDEKNSKKQKKESTEFSLHKMKFRFTKAWMSFLKLQLPLEVYKEVLGNLHQTVIPYLTNPTKLSDFLTRSFDIGGVVSVMALSGLFFLMTKFEYPVDNFYDKLYALLTPSLFMAKHRAKFFELLDACLKTPLFTAHLAAAFAKKLSRLSLEVPPSGVLVIIVLVYNILRRHPSISFMVNQDNSGETKLQSTKSSEEPVTADTNAAVVSDREKQGIDLFNDDEVDPQKSNAMRSSLWEIDTLRHHYSPAVVRLLSIFDNDVTVRSKTSEVNIKDFVSASHGTVFAEEMRRRVKEVPLAFHKSPPTDLFADPVFSCWAF